MIDDSYAKRGRAWIVDIGGSESYWNFLSKEYMKEKRVWIVLVNLSNSTVVDRDNFSYCRANGCNLRMFQSKFFDIAHSNSVIEHLQPLDQISFAQEISRVAHDYYVQTPNFWFPIEPHYMCPFIHWFTINFRAGILTRFGLGHYKKQYGLQALRTVCGINLLDKARLRWIFPDAKIYPEKFLGLTKSLIAIRGV